jgi:hypothetical protein
MRQGGGCRRPAIVPLRALAIRSGERENPKPSGLYLLAIRFCLFKLGKTPVLRHATD